jgi:hypothetical protein
MNPPSFSGHGRYEIVVKGHLDDSSGYWFEGLTMVYGLGEEGTPITTLAGEFVDQAALHGVLATIRDLNLPLIGVWPAQDVTQSESDARDESQANSKGDIP